MDKNKIIRILSYGAMGLSILGIAMVAFMAFDDPQAVMALVNVKLDNTDAYSSIRGVYGGAGLTIGIAMVYGMLKNMKIALGFTALLWGLYAVSRIITSIVEGPLGAFGTQWVYTESFLFLVCGSLWLLNSKKSEIV